MRPMENPRKYKSPSGSDLSAALALLAAFVWLWAFLASLL